MDALFYGIITVDDFIFAHIRGQPKEIELARIEHPLGLVIADNSAGTSFIKHVINNGYINRHYSNIIQAGDSIEMINGISMKGKRHYEVASILKGIKSGGMLVIRLIEPEKCGFGNISQRKSRSCYHAHGKTDSTVMRQTIRIKANGDILLKIQDSDSELVRKRINSLLESFVGISDEELAERILELSENIRNPSELLEVIENSELGLFEFPFEFICDIWAAVDDVKSKRIFSY
ncbi:hypothetical protein GJ496_006353 [Pomphorhynchus laevis]|nr:hypothetical protein GJ496_006353 [Pomphorhynchus laevis]